LRNKVDSKLGFNSVCERWCKQQTGNAVAANAAEQKNEEAVKRGETSYSLRNPPLQLFRRPCKKCAAKDLLGVGGDTPMGKLAGLCCL